MMRDSIVTATMRVRCRALIPPGIKFDSCTCSFHIVIMAPTPPIIINFLLRRRHRGRCLNGEVYPHSHRHRPSRIVWRFVSSISRDMVVMPGLCHFSTMEVMASHRPTRSDPSQCDRDTPPFMNLSFRNVNGRSSAALRHDPVLLPLAAQASSAPLLDLTGQESCYPCHRC